MEKAIDRRDSEARRGEEFRVAPAPARSRRVGLSPEAVRRLSELSPLRATLSLVEAWGTIALLAAVAHRYPHPAVIAAAALGIAARQHALAILTHQAAHYRMVETRWLNDLIGRLCGYPLSTSMLTYRIIHRIHHNHLYSPIDPDLALIAGYPRGRWYLMKKLLKDLFGLTTLKNYRYFFGQPQAPRDAPPAKGPCDDTSPALRAAARRDRQGVVIFQVLVIALMIATGHLREYLMLWVLPLVTVLQVLLRLRAVAEHGAVGDTSTPLHAARTTLAPFWVRWLLFPYEMNYHIEHHLYPSVPHYRLAECHRELRATGALDGAEVMPSLRETLSKVFAPPWGAGTG
jgi:fatty acid desaturase